MIRLKMIVVIVFTSIVCMIPGALGALLAGAAAAKNSLGYLFLGLLFWIIFVLLTCWMSNRLHQYWHQLRSGREY